MLIVSLCTALIFGIWRRGWFFSKSLKLFLTFGRGFRFFLRFFDFGVISPVRTNVNCFALYSPDFWNLKAGWFFSKSLKLFLTFGRGFRFFLRFFDFGVISPVRTNVNCFALYSPDFWNLKAGMIFFQEPKIILNFWEGFQIFPKVFWFWCYFTRKNQC